MIAPAIGMLGFAIALALPFTLFALFPSWLKSMPKSGGWMNVIKVTLGFLELAFALKFLSVADLAYVGESWIGKPSLRYGCDFRTNGVISVGKDQVSA